MSNSDLRDTHMGNIPNIYASIAREFLAINRVYRYHMKKVDEMDDDNVMQVCHFWYTENNMEKEFREYENQRLGIKPNPYNLPINKCDVAAVDWLDREAPERVIPVLPDLMEWLKDMNWPVAQEVLPLMLRYENETTSIAEKILKPDQTDEIWKYNIITVFVPALSGRNRRILQDAVCRIAYQPTPGEQAEQVDAAAKEYLNLHR